MPAPTTYDVCIVGSGAGGGMAAYALTKAGANVVMLEAGGEWYAARRDSKMMCPALRRRRGAARRRALKPFGEFDGCVGGWDIEGEPYTTAPGTQLQLVARAHARRTHQSLGTHLAAFRPRRFQRQIDSTDSATTGRSATTTSSRTTTTSTDLIGIFGSNEGLRNHPDGIFHPAAGAALLRAAGQEGVRQARTSPAFPSRLSIITKPLNGRAACHYCGQCNRGCATQVELLESRTC